MKKVFIAAIMSLSILTTSTYAEIKMGIILGFTGPIESLTPAMAASAELAFKEASDSGSLLGGEKIKPIRAGITFVNTYRLISPYAPFGGMKDSGYGKEAGIESIKEYTRIKTTWFNTSEKPMTDPFTMG